MRARTLSQLQLQLAPGPRLAASACPRPAAPEASATSSMHVCTVQGSVHTRICGPHARTLDVTHQPPPRRCCPPAAAAMDDAGIETGTTTMALRFFGSMVSGGAWRHKTPSRVTCVLVPHEARTNSSAGVARPDPWRGRRPCVRVRDRPMCLFRHVSTNSSKKRKNLIRRVGPLQMKMKSHHAYARAHDVGAVVEMRHAVWVSLYHNADGRDSGQCSQSVGHRVSPPATLLEPGSPHQGPRSREHISGGPRAGACRRRDGHNRGSVAQWRRGDTRMPVAHVGGARGAEAAAGCLSCLRSAHLVKT
jgi:hypothetical protein